MAIIPTTFDLVEHGVYDISRLRADFLRTGGSYPGGLHEAVIDGSESMVVDASADPDTYGWGPTSGSGERWALMGFRALISDGSTAFDGVHFGETGPCTNGVLIQVNRRGTGVIQRFDTILVNPDWAHMAGADVLVLPFGKADDCMLVNVDFRDHHIFTLDGMNNDVFEVVLQDDLDALTVFNVYAWGYKL